MTSVPLRLILASASPRRVELLTNLGLKFTTYASSVSEDFDSRLSPEEIAVTLAVRKAKTIAQALALKPKSSDKNSPPAGSIVLGADTIVVLDGQVLGKPGSPAEAVQMLALLSGKTHEVITGMALISLSPDLFIGEPVTTRVISKVRFRELKQAEIEVYVAGGEPMDKAGSYALQGTASAFVQSIDGCYTNVIGLPIPELVPMLRDMGLKVLGL